jgi:hypothetical protein
MASRSAGSHPLVNRHYTLVLAAASVQVEVEFDGCIKL